MLSIFQMDLNIFIAVLLYSGYASGIVLETHQNEALSISVPASMPTADIEPISRDFAAFAFEERSFYYYFGMQKTATSQSSTESFAGTPNNPNTFSKNLLNAITAKTNAAPNVRVGGSSLDDSQYNPSQPDPIKIPPGEENAGIPNNMTFGPSYFDAFATIPNAKYVVDIPMKKNKLANSKAFAKAAYNKIGADNIVGLEIGNEPDNYGLSKQVYVNRWKKWSAQMMQTLDLGEQKKIFQAVCLASQTGKTGSPGAPGGWRV
ncbi:hypothetical protein SLS60_006097 [Paraconiothyrium brasiliense]|uniref:Glycoside hydrolase family 79 protein n=1 Tax=Paraconiothyrium brasiliense TaxID=300254 RepID=A0ABR3RE07_9PLEO